MTCNHESIWKHLRGEIELEELTIGALDGPIFRCPDCKALVQIIARLVMK